MWDNGGSGTLEETGEEVRDEGGSETLEETVQAREEVRDQEHWKRERKRNADLQRGSTNSHQATNTL